MNEAKGLISFWKYYLEMRPKEVYWLLSIRMGSKFRMEIGVVRFG